MASWQCPSSFIKGERWWSKSLNVAVPQPEIYCGIHLIISGWECDFCNHTLSAFVLSCKSFDRPSEGQRFRCLAHSCSMPQFGQVELARLSIRYGCFPDARKFDACFESHIWYICGLLFVLICRLGQPTRSKTVGCIMLWMEYHSGALCCPIWKWRFSLTSFVCLIPPMNTTTFSRRRVCWPYRRVAKAPLCTEDFAKPSQMQLSCALMEKQSHAMMPSWCTRTC